MNSSGPGYTDLIGGGNSFRGKTALVTGGFSGIGLAVARSLAGRGCHVTAAGLPRGDEPAPVEGGIECRRLDVTDDSAVASLLASLSALHIVVNCAGIIQRDREFELDCFRHVLDVNLTGTMRVCMAAHPLLADAHGAVVNTASMLTYFGGPRVPAYSASKGAVAQLTRSLAIAWAAEGIRVNAVAPGWVTTGFTQALQDDPERSRQILERTPMRRWAQPEEIAEAVLFLCSPAASFITGAVLPVDGGYSAV